jgi:hypothetical protein
MTYWLVARTRGNPQPDTIRKEGRRVLLKLPNGGMAPPGTRAIELDEPDMYPCRFPSYELERVWDERYERQHTASGAR